MKKNLTKLIFGFIFGFSALAANAQYCATSYTNPCYSGAGGSTTNDVIHNFWTTGGNMNISNLASGCSAGEYEFFPGMVVSGCAGQLIGLNVQCDPTSDFAQGFAIWVDWNSDFVFDDATERVLIAPSGFAVNTGSMTIPATAAPGAYRMRVRSQFATGGATIPACGNLPYGEVEDYNVIVETCQPRICQGDTVSIDVADYIDAFPPGPLTYAWEPTTYLDDPTLPIVSCWATEDIDYTCTVYSPTDTTSVLIEALVVIPANPDAGLDDSLCHDTSVPYEFEGTINPDASEGAFTYNWEILSFSGAGSPFTLFTPDEEVIDPSLIVSEPGVYQIEFTAIDTQFVCPPETDLINITFSEESHTTDLTDPTCAGGDDGIIIVGTTGVLGAVEYCVDGGTTWQASPLFAGLTAGDYTVMSRDIIGCESTTEVSLVDPTAVVVTMSADTIVCQNGTASIFADATGGTSFTYNWGIPGWDDTNAQTLNPTDPSTIVTVTAINELGCESDPISMEVTLRAPITISISENDSVCPGYDSGASAVAFGGDGAYTYSWTENGTDLPDAVSFISSNPEEETTYCITVADGCETTPVTVCTQTIMRPVPTPAFTSDVTQACNPSPVNFNTGIVASDSAIWTTNGSTFFGPAISVDYTEVGFYDVTLQVYNQYGCHATITAEEYIEMIDIPYPAIFINPNPTTIFNTTVVLNGESDSEGDTFSWLIEGGQPATSTEEDPEVFFPDGVADTYPVELTVTNWFGCTNTVKDNVVVVSDVIIYAPNAFTPDGDEFNEGWRVFIDGIDIYDYHLMLFNKWGEIVWESYNSEAVWDGTYAGQNAVEGTYIWTIEAKEQTNDRKVSFNGYVTVYR